MISERTLVGCPGLCRRTSFDRQEIPRALACRLVYLREQQRVGDVFPSRIAPTLADFLHGLEQFGLVLLSFEQHFLLNFLAVQTLLAEFTQLFTSLNVRLAIDEILANLKEMACRVGPSM